MESRNEARGDRHAAISHAAYRRAQERGFEAGHALEDWLAAEREIDARAAIARGITPNMTRRADDAV